MTAALLGFLAAFILIFAQVPIALALAVVGFFGFYFLNGLTPALSMIVIAAKESSMAYTLSVIPLFILMGNLVSGGGISRDLFAAAQVFLGRRRGGLAMATILACGGFAAICGSSVATAVTIGKVAIPEMRRYGYADRLTTASIAAGGTLGILIPPSVIMVVYGVLTETHIGKLFAAGLLPGAVAILLYMLAVAWIVTRDPSAAPAAPPIRPGERMAAIKGVWPVVVLFGLVLGGIYSGIATPTEAAGLGALGGLIFAVTRGRLRFAAIWEILRDTVETSAVIFAILLGATIFSEFINLTGVHEGVLSLLSNGHLPSWVVMAIIILVYVVLGCLLESMSMIFLTVPLFFPIVIGMGYDPVWFGILVVVLVELGLITPPIGVNLFVIRSILPDVAMSTILKGIIPFIAADCVRIVLLTSFPIITLWLPNLMFGK